MARDEGEAAERVADQEWLELKIGAHGDRATVELGDRHLAPFGRMYGGIGAALASALIEAATGRRLLWATTQFVGACGGGDRLDLRADVVAAGRRTSQVSVTAHAGGELVLQALGASGDIGTDIPGRSIPEAPVVPSPADCPEMGLDIPDGYPPGFFGAIERRLVDEHAHRWWMRLPDRPLARPALLGLAGDCLPPMVMRELGEPGSGTSLDLTVRVGAPSAGGWLLVDGRPDLAAGGYGHGRVRLWTEDGALAGTVAQTTALWRALG
ncbi:acyl-CoA thioesterase [Spirillospora sp. CA-255316]